MRKLSKRFLSMLMVLVLVLSAVPAVALADDSTNPVTKWNVTLRDNISANFHLTLEDPANTVVKMTVGGDVTTINASDAPQQDGCYVFTVELAAAQMTDDINLNVEVNGTSAFAKAYTIKEYADKILAGEYAAEVKQMVLTMLYYGTAAQNYFGYKLENLANAGCDELTLSEVPASESEVGEFSATGSVSGISYYGASLVFVSRIALRYYFTVADGSNIADYTFKVGDTTYTPVAKDGRYYVEISNIYPQNLNLQYTLTVAKDSETLSVTYGPMNYLVRRYNTSSSESMKALAQMLYTYHEESVVYVEYLQSEALRPKEGNVAALNIHYIRDSAPMSFITKTAYPAGTTFTFKAYQPYIADANNRWWGVGATTDAAAGSIYTCAAAGNNMYNEDNTGYWTEFTYTLPEGSEDSYFYIAGAKNIAWIDDPLLIDDVVITAPDGTSVIDGFEYGLTAGLFNVNSSSASDAKAVTLLDLSPVTDRIGNVAALTINKLNENAPMSFITKEAYAGGSTVGFEAYVPTGASWWAVCWTTDPADVSLYKWSSGLGQNMTSASVKDAWAQYYVTLPDDGNNYYIYVVGAKGEWKDSEGNALDLLIDNVTIAKGSTVAIDDFEGTSLFDFNAGAALLDVTPVTVTAQEALDDLKASYGDSISVGTELASAWTVDGDAFAVTWTATGAASVTDGKLTAISQNEDADYTLTATVTNDSDTASYTWNGTVSARTGNVAAITVNKLNEKTPMSFITKEAYAGGSTVSFEAYVPTGASWWAVCWTTDPANTDLYKWTGGEAYGKSMSSVIDKWAEYSVTLPDDGNNYYIYIVGAKGEWKDAEGNALALLIDNVTITSGSTSVTDGFERGLTGGLFDVNSEDTAELLNLDPVTVTAQEALDDLKAHYGDAIDDGTELVSNWTVDGNDFIVNWTVDEGASVASIEDNKLVTKPQGTTVNYLLKATVSKNEDTASYSWIDSAKPQSNTVAAITIDKLNENAPMSFITKEAYAGGSTVTFDAYVPTGASWWAVCWTTDPANTSLYKWTGGAAYGKSMASVTDQWAEYSVTLPNDSNSYYIYIVGAKGEWKGNTLLIDNVVISKSGSTVATDDFEGTSLFAMGNDAQLQTIEPEEVTPRAGNYVAIYPDYLTEEAPMSFITKEAYAGGSTVSFEAYVPTGNSWWAVCWTTDPSNVSLYKWTSGLGQNLLSATVNDAWADYSVTLPNDGNSYYVYIVGAKGEWNDKAVLIDNVTIGNVTEDFENGLDNSIFNYIERSSGGESLVELQTYNYAQEITVANLATGIDFITKKAFPAGSTVTFDAKVPAEHDWWALDWTTDPGSVNNEDARYNHSTSGTTLNSFTGKWSNYTVKLPDSGGPYHLYFAGANEWGSNTLLIDNFKVTDADGTVLAEENFNHAISDSIFVANPAAVTMSEILSYTENDEAEIQFTAYSAPTVNRDVPANKLGAISAAYRKMADAGFNKAIAVAEGLSGKVTATDIAEIKAQIAERSAYAEEVAQRVMEKAQKFGITYYAKDWSLYNMGGSGTDEYGVNSSFGLTQTDFNDIISTMFNSDNPYHGNSGYAGHFGYDEPYYADLEKVGWAAQAYKATGVSGELFVNLLPPYVNKNSPQLGAESKWEQWFGNYTYENYLNEYLNQTNGSLDYICWDYYPFLKDDSSLSNEQALRTRKYLSSYELMAQTAATNNRELRVIIQSSGDSVGVRNLAGKSELSFQIYSGLSFGVKEFIYYLYSGSSETGYDYIFHANDQTYNDTVYGWAQEVNLNVHSFEEVYDEYTWSNVMKVDSDNSNIMMNNLTSAVTSHDKIKVEGEGDYLVGLFTAKDSASTRKNAFMLVNAEYDPNAAAHDVVLTMSGARAVSIYRNGEQTVMKLNDTQCILRDVQPGEGIFLVPLY